MCIYFEHCILSIFTSPVEKKIHSGGIRTHILCHARAHALQTTELAQWLEAVQIIYFNSGYRNDLINAQSTSGIKIIIWLFPHTSPPQGILCTKSTGGS